MTERIISADSHLELKPEKILAHLPRQHHEAYQGALTAMYSPAVAVPITCAFCAISQTSVLGGG